MKINIKNMRLKKNFIYILFLLFGILIVSHFTISSNGNPVGNLKEGKNYFVFNVTSSFSADQLFVLNPELEVISYYDPVQDKNFSYVNVFGGVGKNFRIYPDKIYEIYSSDDILLEAPWKYADILFFIFF